jgi:hypothetical protein
MNELKITKSSFSENLVARNCDGITDSGAVRSWEGKGILEGERVGWD